MAVGTGRSRACGKSRIACLNCWPIRSGLSSVRGRKRLRQLGRHQLAGDVQFRRGRKMVAGTCPIPSWSAGVRSARQRRSRPQTRPASCDNTARHRGIGTDRRVARPAGQGRRKSIGWKPAERGRSWLNWPKPRRSGAGRNAYIGTDLDLLGRRRTSFDFVVVAKGDIPLGRIRCLLAGRVRVRIVLDDGHGGTCDHGNAVAGHGGLSRRGSVILISAEDDPGDTIRPRLDAHHADVRRVHLLSAVRRVDDAGHH